MRRIGFCFGLVAVVLMGCASRDDVEHQYVSLAAAIREGAIRDGRVPEFLPPSARMIREVRNVDTSEAWLRFEADPSDLDSLSSCTRQTRATIQLPKKGPKDWWPAALLQSKDVPAEDGKVYLACVTKSFAVYAPATGEAYWWRPPVEKPKS